MCGYDPISAVAKEVKRGVSSVTEEAKRGASAALGGVPTMPDLTGVTAQKEAARQATAAEAEAASLLLRQQQEQLDAAARKKAEASGRAPMGRASTMLTGPRGIIGSAFTASRALL